MNPTGISGPQDVERKIFESFWDDGLIDIIVGLGLGLIGVTWILSVPVLGILVPIALVPVWAIARRQISIPIAGYVKFSRERSEDVHRTSVILIITGYVVLVSVGTLYVFARSAGIGSDLLSRLVVGVPALTIAVLVLLSRFLFDMPFRTLGYSIMVLSVSILGMVSGLDPAYQFLAIGGGFVAVGSVLFRRFLLSDRKFDEPT